MTRIILNGEEHFQFLLALHKLSLYGTECTIRGHEDSETRRAVVLGLQTGPTLIESNTQYIRALIQVFPVDGDTGPSEQLLFDTRHLYINGTCDIVLDLCSLDDYL